MLRVQKRRTTALINEVNQQHRQPDKTVLHYLIAVMR